MPEVDRRNIVVAFRITTIEAAHIDAAGAALRNPRNRADYARAAALHAARHAVPAPASPVRRPARRQPTLDTQQLAKILAAIGGIASSVTGMSKETKTTRAAAEIADSLAAIRDQITDALTGGRS